MRFEFSTSNRILFGPGTCAEVPAISSSLGRCAFVVTDSQERCSTLVNGMLRRGSKVELFIVNEEPNLELILLATRISQKYSCELVISFGGGSALDTGKAVAALVTNPGNPINYLEVVGAGLVLENLRFLTWQFPPLPAPGPKLLEMRLLPSRRNASKSVCGVHTCYRKLLLLTQNSLIVYRRLSLLRPAWTR